MVLANTAFFGFVCWYFWQGVSVVPFRGKFSITSHVLALSFLTGFIFSYLATITTRKALRRIQIKPLHWHFKSKTMIDQLPRHSVQRACVVSLMGGFLGFLVLLLFKLKGIHQLPGREFLIFNLIYAAHLAAGAAAISVYRAMCDYTSLREESQLWR